MKENTATSASALLANEVGYDPIEDRLRLNIRALIEAVFEEELEQFLGRCRYGRSGAANFATIKHAANNLLQKAPGKKSLPMKRHSAAWDDDYLQAIIMQ